MAVLNPNEFFYSCFHNLYNEYRPCFKIQKQESSNDFYYELDTYQKAIEIWKVGIDADFVTKARLRINEGLCHYFGAHTSFYKNSIIKELIDRDLRKMIKHDGYIAMKGDAEPRIKLLEEAIEILYTKTQ